MDEPQIGSRMGMLRHGEVTILGEYIGEAQPRPIDRAYEIVRQWVSEPHIRAQIVNALQREGLLISEDEDS